MNDLIVEEPRELKFDDYASFKAYIDKHYPTATSRVVGLAFTGFSVDGQQIALWDGLLTFGRVFRKIG